MLKTNKEDTSRRDYKKIYKQNIHKSQKSYCNKVCEGECLMEET